VEEDRVLEEVDMGPAFRTKLRCPPLVLPSHHSMRNVGRILPAGCQIFNKELMIPNAEPPVAVVHGVHVQLPGAELIPVIRVITVILMRHLDSQLTESTMQMPQLIGIVGLVDRLDTEFLVQCIQFVVRQTFMFAVEMDGPLAPFTDGDFLRLRIARQLPLCFSR